MRQRKPKRRKSSGVGRLFLWTAVLGVLASIGIIAGQRIMMDDGFLPIVSVAPATPALSSNASLASDEDSEEAPRPSLFSFYDALTSAEVREVTERVAPRRTPRTEAPRQETAPAPAPAPAEPEPTPSEPDSAPPPAEEKPAEEAQAPQEREVQEETDAPARYTLQIASHPTMERARAEMDRLRELGLEPHVVAADVPGQGQFYRVRVGKYPSMDEARSAQNQIRAVRELQTFVTPL